MSPAILTYFSCFKYYDHSDTLVFLICIVKDIDNIYVSGIVICPFNFYFMFVHQISVLWQCWHFHSYVHLYWIYLYWFYIYYDVLFCKRMSATDMVCRVSILSVIGQCCYITTVCTHVYCNTQILY